MLNALFSSYVANVYNFNRFRKIIFNIFCHIYSKPGYKVYNYKYSSCFNVVKFCVKVPVF
jgi:hypothetical protein